MFPDIMSRLRSIQADFTARDDPPSHQQVQHPGPEYSPPVQTSPPPVFMFDNKTSMDIDKSGYMLTLLLFGNIGIILLYKCPFLPCCRQVGAGGHGITHWGGAVNSMSVCIQNLCCCIFTKRDYTV